MHLLWIALILGLVEGLTEFLPISSTGHLIVTSELLDFRGPRAQVFQIFIQLGAILSVVWEYRVRLWRVASDLPRGAGGSRRFVAHLALAFLPSALIGLLVYPWIKANLFSPVTVAMALGVGGLLILVVESLPLRVRTERAEEIGTGQAIAIGFAQCLSLWSGFSRSAATILGGLGVGMSRRAATEFSFFLAIPTMFAATFYDLYKNYAVLEPGDWPALALSFVVSFLVAWASIRWLLRYVSTHSFRLFAWYRIVLSLLIMLYLARS